MAEFTVAKDAKGKTWRINLDNVNRIELREDETNILYFSNGDVMTVGPIYTPLLQVD